MMFYNILDEEGRFKGLKIDPNGNGQYNTHSVSYLWARQVYYRDITGEPIGLERLPKGELEDRLKDVG